MMDRETLFDNISQVNVDHITSHYCVPNELVEQILSLSKESLRQGSEITIYRAINWIAAKILSSPEINLAGPQARGELIMEWTNEFAKAMRE